MASSISSSGKTFIKGYEGKGISGADFQPYYDAAGYPTVGYGHLLTKSTTGTKNSVIPYATAKTLLQNAGIAFTDNKTTIVISSSTADSLFNTRVSGFSNKVAAHSKSSKMTQNQFDALTSIIFNCGEGVLTSSDMVTLLNNGQTYSDFIGPIEPAHNQRVTNAFKWTKAGGVQVQGLVNRRNAEMAKFCTGMRYSYVPI